MSEQFEKGYNAYLDGADISDNPYRVNSQNFHEWNEGFTKAEFDCNNRD